MKKRSKETQKSFLKIACIIAVSLTVLQSCKKDKSNQLSEQNVTAKNVTHTNTVSGVSGNTCYKDGPLITITDANGIKTVLPRTKIECYMVDLNWTPPGSGWIPRTRPTGTVPNVPPLPPEIPLEIVKGIDIEINNACLNTKIQNIFLETSISFTITDIIRKISRNPYFFVKNTINDGSLQSQYASTTSTYSVNAIVSPVHVDNTIVLNKNILSGANQNFLTSLIIYETMYGCFTDGSGASTPAFGVASLRDLDKWRLTTEYIQPLVDYLTKNSSVLMQKEDALALAWYFLRTTNAYTDDDSSFDYKDDQDQSEITMSKAAIESRNASLLASFSGAGCN
ncbi:hypothetical protein [Pedobacter gandavensis]|uniref:hypothetical protein n=1 Tax=Pedobacter gandavensis TaxID=2679963 RepID=UPI00292CCD4C|nr:hypothetical protein [Pedobacter gandavensis]